MGMISDNIQRVRTQIDAACVAHGRSVRDVQLLAVSKTFGAEAVMDAYACGQRAFGENYIQEGVDKITALQHVEGIEWHMIGPLQSNKTRWVAEHFAWVQSVDRLKIAQRLSEQRPAQLPPLQVCIQVNVDGGANKSGVMSGDALKLAHEISLLPRLVLRGMMAIPEPATDFIAACAVFKSAFEVFSSLKASFPKLDTCSMGMTSDLEAAIASGSTMVRVGTAIFGQRG